MFSFQDLENQMDICEKCRRTLLVDFLVSWRRSVPSLFPRTALLSLRTVCPSESDRCWPQKMGVLFLNQDCNLAIHYDLAVHMTPHFCHLFHCLLFVSAAARLLVGRLAPQINNNMLSTVSDFPSWLPVLRSGSRIALPVVFLSRGLLNRQEQRKQCPSHPLSCKVSSP